MQNEDLDDELVDLAKEMDEKTVYEFKAHLYNWTEEQYVLEDETLFDSIERKLDGEQVAKDFFRAYKVYDVEPGMKISKLPDEVKEHPMVEGEEVPRGFPDLVVETKASEIAYAEVKKESDGLRKCQLDFLNQSDQPAFVFWITKENTGREKIDIICGECERRFDREIEYINHSCAVKNVDKVEINWDRNSYGFL